MNIILMLVLSCTIGCSPCRVADHSCPEPGHGPCYLCDDDR